MKVNVHEAKTHLSRLLKRVEAGEEVAIARSGRTVARLVPASDSKTRTPGTAKGKLKIHKKFDSPLPREFLEHFE